jgi:hypothetical protein
MKYSDNLAREYGRGQLMVEWVEYSERVNAERLARFLNRHLGSGQASVQGNVVLVGEVPCGAMKKAYLAIGALPRYERFR